MNLFKYFFFFIAVSHFSFAQEKNEDVAFVKKKIQAVKLNSTIKIDGDLNDIEWKNAPVAKDFVMFDPDNGRPEAKELRTEVKVLYDNDAVYIGATLYDNEPNKILKEISERDDLGTADLFGVFINGFNDGQQEYSFNVTASNGQLDLIRTPNGEDDTWDAIWHSQTKISSEGWHVEIKIPYAALRFSKEDQQTWGIQFFREVRRLRQKFTWNPVDNRKGAFTQQAGILEGIENINTPTRLFLIPYSSFYLNSPAKEKTFGTLKGGLDLKYGLTDAFTLDMVLIPDFGQTKFDNTILNLGPFEQVFNENRPFFTEGTDLFNKGDLFYSRRIGQRASTFPKLTATEEVVELPNAIDLVNAVKISGRTKDGLGVGFLNTVTKKTDVVIRDVVTGNERVETVEPLANYNVLVLDQRFNGNSSVSLINTNVTRNGEFRDANVTATAFNLNNKKNTFNTNGNFKYSYVNSFKNLEDKKGISTNLYFAETSGNVRFSFGGEYVSDDYDNNDLGINFQTNYYSFSGNASYRTLKPTNKLNSFRINFNAYTQYDVRTNYLQEQNFNINGNLTTKQNHAAGFGININPFERHNFYNPQVEGRYVIFPKNYGTWMWISTNYNNKFAFDVEPNVGFTETKGWWYWGFSVSPRYRFNDKFTLIYRNNFNNEYQDLGRVDRVGNDIVFAKRDNQTLETSLEGKYSVNSQMNFGLKLRHYWSFSENNSYHRLLENGYVEAYNYTDNANQNLNLWNFDLTYSWWFAPGSQMSVLYRNSSGIFENEIDKDFSYNAKQVFNHEQLNHIFSISVRYFIDYNQAKNVFKPKV
ncbi:DUF5916 domain-containing protein [Flavobacterium difficile]|uniref:Carbohydrate binding family 9 domain-containing protein n=1 Tax=Flavobacterium difficile TaxID=2709659 RepID=A0ABX0I5D7_9FLAO|nr:DUF5916 domain-containing protein [Flavobacterium difficile]NHM01817.1 carbohydrate binding family 9 domain-containing protein [Flavobacterium difficile]